MEGVSGVPGKMGPELQVWEPEPVLGIIFPRPQSLGPVLKIFLVVRCFVGRLNCFKRVTGAQTD